MKEIQQEITPITNEDLFIILNHPNAHFDYPIHCHPEYEINLVMNTRGSRIVGDSTEDFGPLDLVMTGPYVPHVLMSNLCDSKNIVHTSKSRRIAKVCDYIEKNLCQNIRLTDVAGLVNMSESAFSHFFKKRTNISYITFVNNMRISKACQLLANTTLSASEICYACGFNNKSNFIRIFTKKKNMTPIEYREYISQMLIKY